MICVDDFTNNSSYNYCLPKLCSFAQNEEEHHKLTVLAQKHNLDQSDSDVKKLNSQADKSIICRRLWIARMKTLGPVMKINRPADVTSVAFVWRS